MSFSGARSRVIVQNTDNLETLVSFNIANRKNLRLIKGAGVDTCQFSPIEKSDPIPLVVLPARLLFSKGVCDFVAAASNLKAKGLRARFALVGDRDPRNPECIPQSLVDKWAQEGVVEIWGRCEDMHLVMKQASIVCLPSYSEGLPKALLEAASCALPIVAYDIPGCREFVINNDNGYLIPFRNQVLLDAALGKLINNPELRKIMGAKGRLRVLNGHSKEIISRETIGVWSEVLP
jgi:glycosyltransferase involved in cell wall biosynthesis